MNPLASGPASGKRRQLMHHDEGSYETGDAVDEWSSASGPARSGPGGCSTSLFGRLSCSVSMSVLHGSSSREGCLESVSVFYECVVERLL